MALLRLLQDLFSIVVAVGVNPDGHAIDKRLVYDTRILGNKNTGHEFSDVLTEQERRAIMEYLKTL